MNFSINQTPEIYKTSTEICQAVHDDLLRQIGGKIPYIIFALGILITIMMINESLYLINKARKPQYDSLNNPVNQLTKREIIKYIWLIIIYALSLYLVFAYKLF